MYINKIVCMYEVKSPQRDTLPLIIDSDYNSVIA